MMLGRPTTTSMADLFVIKEVFIHETYQDILTLIGSKPLNVVDIGANLGSFCIWLHHRIGLNRAYCFEPEADSFKLLNFNLAHNRCSTVQPTQAAMGGWARTAEIQLNESSPGGTSLYGERPFSSRKSATIIKVLAFDEWLASVPESFDLLKLDCEGAEWEILRKCGKNTFPKFRVVVAEVHDDPEGKHRVDEFKPLMEELGFRTIRWDGKSQGLYVGTQSR